MTDADRAPQPELIARALPRGAAIIIRDYDAHRREAFLRRLVSIARPRGVLVLVGADFELAHKVGADGVHLPGWAKISGRPDIIVSCACHNAGDLQRAGEMGADVAVLSPVFPTGSHPGAQTLGAAQFRALAAQATLPVIALGGVDEHTARLLAGQNVAGLAAIGAFLPQRN